MNLTELQRKLLAAARANGPNDRVPYAFEKRILARLQAEPAVDAFTLWSRALGRAAVLCVAVVVLLGAWSFWTLNDASSADDLPKAFENTVLAALDQPDDSW